jgi:hypothetical protein
MALHLHTVAAREGLAWLKAAFAVFARRPLGLTAMFVLFLFGSLLLLAVPLVGTLVVMMALPMLSLGFMVATRSVLRGGPAHPGQFVEPLRGNERTRSRLLQLCVIYGLVTVMIIALADTVDGGRFERLQVLLATPERSSVENAELEALFADPRLSWGMVVRFGFAALLAVPFWHAPALVLWGGQGVGQALFSSTLAVWRNRGAMLVYLAGWAGLIAAFAVTVGLLFGLLGARQLVGLVALPAMLMFTCVFYVSLYFTFVAAFGEASPTGPLIARLPGPDEP